jgi:DNA-binding MarR family transcriptional regulator
VGSNNWITATAILRLASDLVGGVQQGLAERGFTDVRPVHGFAFARLSEAPATTTQLAAHLGITKQATSELVAHLVKNGYLTREPDPADRRAQLLVLTNHGNACTRAAQQAAADTVDRWNSTLTPQEQADLHRMLTAISSPGPLRPAW